MDYSLEPLEARHRQPVIDIFNQFIRQSHAAFLDEPVSYTFFDHFLKITRGYPAVVVRSTAQQVVGFAFLRPHYSPEAFKRAAEITYFILPQHTRQGLGTAILELFVEQAASLNIDTILACVSSKNLESLKFHLKNGFRECGRFLKVGRKFGEDFDAVWLQKRL
ncbi:MAG: N-acetyltransferase family protein [Deltaproteobacteria bacterium]|nr:N-acetyltransferase family protein [Deltaproteobacteria bacterium]